MSQKVKKWNFQYILNFNMEPNIIYIMFQMGKGIVKFTDNKI